MRSVQPHPRRHRSTTRGCRPVFRSIELEATLVRPTTDRLTSHSGLVFGSVAEISGCAQLNDLRYHVSVPRSFAY